MGRLIMCQNTSPAVSSVAKIVHPAGRWVLLILWIAFGVIVTALVGLGFASSFVGGGILTGWVGALIALASVFGIRCLPPHSVMRLAVGFLVLAGVLFSLAHDDGLVRHPSRLEPVQANFPGASESYAVLMRYGKQQPLGRDFRLTASAALQQGSGKWKPSDPGWREWLIANRAEIVNGWTNLEPIRSWWTELNAFERLGDLTPPKSDADIPAFQPIRAVFQHGCGMASLHAIDGNEAAAVQTLLPILELSRKLQPLSRTLVRSMIGVAGEKLALETTAFIFDTMTVSPEGRASLTSALRGGSTAEEGARRLVTIEYEWAMAFLSDPKTARFPIGLSLPRWMQYGVPWLAWVIYNPQRTLNLYSDMMAELQERAINRQQGDLDALTAMTLRAPRLGFKNFAGNALLRGITPNYNKLLETHWKSADLRSALQQRVQGGDR